MLDFFRRYQRYIFLVITVIVIISFSFFGTYSTLGSNTWREQIAFTAINGKEIPRSDVEEMAQFLATDSEDKLLYGGAWGPNFLNDGVIRKDFLETGMARELIVAYQADMQEELQKRLEKEKKYALYTHPQARFLSAENAWSFFMPDLVVHFHALRAAGEAASPDAVDNRIQLFLAEKKFPSPMLKQVLRYQEKQYNWLMPDERLDQVDLSLFGYHTIEDWFSPGFTRLVSEFIMNAAVLAEAQGYQVSKAEAMADLIRNTQISYQQNQDQSAIGVASPEEYFSEQLRQLNIDQARAVKIWRQVLLFRRYFQDAGHSALVDTLAYQRFNQFAHENITADLYQLPAELRLGDFDTLQKLESYLIAAAKPNQKDPLALPREFFSATEVSRAYPELVQKRYALEVAQVTEKNLQARIGIKDMWNWEVSEQNWPALKAQFPDLALKPSSTREERFEALDSLDAVTRSKVDASAKKALVDSHPEWVQQGLAEAQPQKMMIGLRLEGGSLALSGLDKKDKRQELMRLLDQAPLKSSPLPESPLFSYTADGNTYYRITVWERAAQPEILTFAEASLDGTLDAIRTRLANQSFSKTLEALQLLQKTLAIEGDSKDRAASLRFYPHLQQVKAKLEKDPSQADQFARSQAQEEPADLSKRAPLADQWLLEKTTVSVSRQNQVNAIEITEAFALPLEGWSHLKAPVNGDLAFYQVKGRGENAAEQEVALADQVKQAQSLLAAEAQRVLMQHVLQAIKDKNAISLNFLHHRSDDIHN